MFIKDTRPEAERSEESYFCIKYSLFATNFLVWVGGVCLMVIGVWTRLEKAQLNYLSGLPTDPAFFLVSVGVVVFLTTIFGCIGSVKENIVFLKMFCVLMLVVFVLQAIATILAFIFLDKVDAFLLAYVKRAIIGYHGNDELKLNMDYIQKREDVASERVYTMGCISVLLSMFKDHLVVIGCIAFTCGILELVAVLLAHALIRVVTLSKLSANTTSKYRPWKRTRRTPQNHIVYPTPPKYPSSSGRSDVNLTRL